MSRTLPHDAALGIRCCTGDNRIHIRFLVVPFTLSNDGFEMFLLKVRCHTTTFYLDLRYHEDVAGAVRVVHLVGRCPIVRGFPGSVGPVKVRPARQYEGDPQPNTVRLQPRPRRITRDCDRLVFPGVGGVDGVFSYIGSVPRAVSPALWGSG